MALSFQLKNRLLQGINDDQIAYDMADIAYKSVT